MSQEKKGLDLKQEKLQAKVLIMKNYLESKIKRKVQKKPRRRKRAKRNNERA